MYIYIYIYTYIHKIIQASKPQPVNLPIPQAPQRRAADVGVGRITSLSTRRTEQREANSNMITKKVI